MSNSAITQNCDQDRNLTLCIQGDVLSTTAPQFAEEINDILVTQSDFQKLTLDLNAANMIDSMGLNMLIGFAKKMQSMSKPLKVYISSPSVKRIFSFSKIDSIIEVVFEEKNRPEEAENES